MNKFFDMDSPFIQFLNRVADLMILNFLVMICSLPVITAGAAYTAMHYVLLKIVRKEEGYLLRGFFKSFKQNFKQATLIWLGVLLVIALYVVDFLIFRYSELEFSKLFMSLLLAVAIVFIFLLIYIFPLLAHFDNSIKNIVKNALSLAFIKLPKTLLMAVIYILPFVLAYYFEWGILFAFVFGISLPAYAAAMIYSKIFKTFEPEQPEVVSDYDFSIVTDEGNEENE